MADAGTTGAPPRLADPALALSLAGDLGVGQPMEYALRSCLLGMRLSAAAGLGGEEASEVYWVTLLRWLGCTGHAHELSALFGDELAMRARIAGAEFGSPAVMAREIVRHGGGGRPLPGRLATVAALLVSGPRPFLDQFRASCEVAETLARRLGLGPGTCAALTHVFERWDGRGLPGGLRGDAIRRAARVAVLAQDPEVLARAGPEAALEAVRRRRGRSYDPELCAVVSAEGPALFAGLDDGATAARVLDAEPHPRVGLPPGGLDTVLEVLGDYADLKSPMFAGHARAVAATASAAARAAGMSAAECVQVRRAGLVQDLGRIGVGDDVWERPGPLREQDHERVRLHPYLSERVLARTGCLADLAPLAAAHHERIDGGGYHRGLPASAITPAQRLLAAADVLEAMREPRPHRAALSAGAAAAELRALVAAGALDGRAVDAVLSAAGLEAPPPASRSAGGLTEREVEVVRLVVRGLRNREVAARLGISDRTVGHHIQHVYDKTGVSTRAALTLFAVERGLLDGAWPEPPAAAAR